MKLKIKYNIFFVLISLIVVFILIPLRNDVFSPSIIIAFSIIAFLNVIIFFKTSSLINSHWIRFEIIFLLAFLIVHFQIPFFASFGWEPENADFIWINKNVVNFATWLSLIALLFWILGFLLMALFKKRNVKDKLYKSVYDLRVILKRLKYLILILFLFFIFLVGNEFLNGSYDGGKNWGSGASYINLVLINAIIIYLIVLFIIIINN